MDTTREAHKIKPVRAGHTTVRLEEIDGVVSYGIVPDEAHENECCGCIPMVINVR